MMNQPSDSQPEAPEEVVAPATESDTPKPARKRRAAPKDDLISALIAAEGTIQLMGLVGGFASGTIPDLPANQVLLRNRTVLGVDWGAWAMGDPDANATVLVAYARGARDRIVVKAMIALARELDAGGTNVLVVAEVSLAVVLLTRRPPAQPGAAVLQRLPGVQIRAIMEAGCPAGAARRP